MAGLSPSIALGPVRLTVADATGVGAFYERVVGLRPLGPPAAAGVVRLGASAGAPTAPPLVELVEEPSARPRDRHACGLFHLALLVPDRVSLAQALRRIVAAGWRIDGASDHLVSEALYLSDPAGNGIEIYRDRPRAEWRRSASGELAMATLPLDLNDLAGELADLAPERDVGMPPGTTLGHVHLQVSDLGAAEAFYADALGFDVMVRGYPGALFVAAGGYHHHVGLNTWASAGGPPRDPSTRGLRDVAIVLPDATERDAAAARLADAGHAVTAADGGDDVLVTDPFGIDLRLRAG
jgi:catechol 2,3-dioxygenase